MHKTPQPADGDGWLCYYIAGGPGFNTSCPCFQGYEGIGWWRVYVDRNGVAYTVWEIPMGKPF